jgi:asparagine synthase (glutamine-hydrolysing)
MANKRLLFETLRRPLPESVFDRPKQGFTFPFAQWLKSDLREFVEAGQRFLVDEGWLQPRVPGQLREGFETGAVHWSRLWSLGVFGQMCQMQQSAARSEQVVAVPSH